MWSTTVPGECKELKLTYKYVFFWFLFAFIVFEFNELTEKYLNESILMAVIGGLAYLWLSSEYRKEKIRTQQSQPKVKDET